MKRALKFTVIGILGLVILVSVVLAWVVNDDDFLRNRVESLVEQETGRQMALGRLDLEFGSLLEVRARNLRIANIEWGTAADLASVDELYLSLDAQELLGGRIAIEALSVSGVQVNLEEDDSGRANWLLTAGDEEADEDNGQAFTMVPWKRLDVADLRLNLMTPDRKAPLDLEVGLFKAQQSASGRVEIATNGRVGQYSLEIEGFADPLNALFTGGAQTHSFSAALGEIQLQSDGSIQDASTGAGARIDTRFSGPDFGWLLEQAGSPVFSSGEFDVGMTFSRTDDGMLKLDLDGDLGDFSAYADGVLDRIIDPSLFNLSFQVEGPDLLSLGDALGVTGLPQEAYEFSGKLNYSDGDLNVDRFEAGIADDRITVNGLLGAWPELDGTDLVFDISGRNIRAWENLIGIEGWADNPFSLSGRFEEKDGLVHMHGTKASVGNNHAELEGVLGPPPQMLGSDIRFNLGIPDLSTVADFHQYAFADKLPLTLDGDIRRNAKGIEVAGGSITSKQHRLNLDGMIELNTEPDGSQPGNWQALMRGSRVRAKLLTPDIRMLAETFGLSDLPAHPFTASADLGLDQDGLFVNLFSDPSAELDFQVSARLSDFSQLVGARADFQFSVPNLKMVEAIAVLPKLPNFPASAKGSVRVEQGLVQFSQVEGEIGGADVTLKGALGIEPEVTVHDATFSIHGPDFGTFFDHEVLTGLPREFTVSGTITPGPIQQQVEDFSISLGQSRLEMSGTINRIPEPDEFDLAVEFSAPNPEGLEAFLNYHGVEVYPRKPIGISFNMSRALDTVNFAGIELEIDSSRVSGEASLKPGNVPEIRGHFNSEYLDLGWLHFFPEKPVGDSSSGPQAEAGSDGPDAESGDSFFSEDSVPYFDVQPVFVDVSLDLAEVHFGAMSLTEVDLGLAVTESYLRLDPIRLTDQTGGRIDGAASLTRNGETLEAAIAGEAIGFRIGLVADGDQPISSYPPWDVHIDMTAEGTTRQEMAVSSKGRLNIILGEGQVLNNRINAVFSDILMELFEKLNPFTETSRYTNVDCGILVVNFDEGDADIDPFIIQTDKIVTTSKGEVDLTTERIDLRFSTRTRRGIGVSAGTIINPFIKLGGTLTRPSIVLDPGDAAIQGSAAVATGGLSLIGKSLFDRFLRQRDPCGKVVTELRSMNASVESTN